MDLRCEIKESLQFKILNYLLITLEMINLPSKFGTKNERYIQSNQSTNSHLSTIYIGSNLNLSTTATSTALRPQLPKKPLHKGQFFQRLTNKSGMVRKFDPYGALMTIFVRGEQHDMLFSPTKNCHITPPPPHNGHPSTIATFSGPQSGCFGEV